MAEETTTMHATRNTMSPTTEESEETASDTSTAPFRLMDLPRELRDMIYEHAVTIDIFTFQGVYLFDHIAPEKATADRMAEERSHCLDNFRTLALLNRQVHGEVVPIFFEQNRFEFWMTNVSNAIDAGNWLYRVDAAFVARMRKVRIVQALDAEKGSVDITVLKNDDVEYRVEWHGVSWCNGEGANEAIEETQTYRSRYGLIGDAMHAASRRMEGHLHHHRWAAKHFLLDQPFIDHSIEPQRGRSTTRPPVPELYFTPELIRKMLHDIYPIGPLRVPLGTILLYHQSECFSPEDCQCEECLLEIGMKTCSLNVNEEERRDQGWPFEAHPALV